jgi:glutamyl-tRNA synthetase
MALAKLKGNADAPALLAALADAFEALTDDWSGETAKAAIGETAKARGVKPGKLMFPTRVALSGRTAGPDLAAILSILGREESARRVRGYVEALKG